MTKRHRQVELTRPLAGARSTPAFVSSRPAKAGVSRASSSSASSASDAGDDDADAPVQLTTTKSDLHLNDGSSERSDADFDGEELGDDGNNDEADDDSSDFDEEADEGEEGEEGDDEEGSGGSDDDDDDDTKEITVHFDVMEMTAGDGGHLYHLVDQLVPDHMEEIDRDLFAAALLASPFTSLVKLGGEESTDETEVFGLISILDVAHGMRGAAPQKKCFAALCKLLRESAWAAVEPGIPAIDVLTAFEDVVGGTSSSAAVAPEDRRSKAVLLVQEYIRNVPLELTSQILQHTLKTFRHDALRWSKKRDKAVPLLTVSPCMFVVLAKIQRSAESVKKPTAVADAGVAIPVKKKARKERGGLQDDKTAQQVAHSSTNKLDISEFIFWREEDETFYEFRDKRVAVTAFRCRAQYDSQPQSEIPLSLCFALTNEGLEQAMQTIKSRETIVPLP
jgi:hypothetical protein